MNKKSQISQLLQHASISDISIHKHMYHPKKKSFSLALFKKIYKEQYKAYARFPEKKIHDRFYATLLKTISKFVTEKRMNRSFEIYLYFNEALYHYYIKKQTLEILPLTHGNEVKLLFASSLPKKLKCILMITIALHSLPNIYKNWWYRNHLLEAGRLTEIITQTAQKNKMHAEIINFYDDRINAFLNLLESKETIIQTLILT